MVSARTRLRALTTIAMIAALAPAQPPGARIIGLKRLDDTTIRRKEFTGDNWHTSWAADGHQYVLQCDGRGYNTRLWRLRGQPPDFSFEPVASHPGPAESDAAAKAGRARYYGFGILAVGDTITHFLSTPNTWYKPPYRFIGSKCILSPDGGATWTNHDGSGPVAFPKWDERTARNMTFFQEPGDCFSLLTILQMGKGYEQNKDGYAYVYAPNGNLEGSMNQLVLARAAKNNLHDRAAFEFFAGFGQDGQPRWSKQVEDRVSVHTFPKGWVNKIDHPYSWHPSVAYNEPFGVYMMANWGIGTDATGRWFTKPSYFGFYVADKPWGPWRQIHEETAWFPSGGDPGGQCYQPQIMPGWIAPDGKSFWLAWTQFPRGYYFQCQKVELDIR